MVAETRPSEDSVMARTARRLLTVAFLGGVLAMPAARAQAPAPPPAAATPAPATSPPPRHRPRQPARLAELSRISRLRCPTPRHRPRTSGWEPEFLQVAAPAAGPAPLVVPAGSRARSAAAGPGTLLRGGPAPRSAALGRSPVGSPTCRFGVIHPHINYGQMRLINSLKLPSGQRVIVAPGAAKLNWTVAPRIEIGYRLPSGFGGLAFSDRFFNTSGTGPFVGPAGSTTRTTSLGVNYSDWDYISREFTPWDTPGRTGAWSGAPASGWPRPGPMSGSIKPFAQAAATNGVFIQGTSNYTVGAGPHFGLELNARISRSGLSFIAKVDIADTFTRDRQLFAASTTTLNAAGVPERGAYTQNFWSQVPILNYQVGVGWQPPTSSQRQALRRLRVRVLVAICVEHATLNPYTTQGGTRGRLRAIKALFSRHSGSGDTAQTPPGLCHSARSAGFPDSLSFSFTPRVAFT